MTDKERIEFGTSFFLKAAILSKMANELREQGRMILGDDEPTQSPEYIDAVNGLLLSMPPSVDVPQEAIDEINQICNEGEEPEGLTASDFDRWK